MIFVTVGTQKQDFSRLFLMIENSKVLKEEEMLIQVGNTPYETKYSDKHKVVSFLTQEEMQQAIEASEFMITHAGVGSILSGILEGKKVLAIPRLKKYKEHINDHQIEICEALSKEGYIEYLIEETQEETLDKKIILLREKSYLPYHTDDSYLDILRKEI